MDLHIEDRSMYATNRLTKKVAKFGVLLMMVVNMSACGFGSLAWDEEVQLRDGKVIIVERELISEAGGGEWVTNRSGTKPKEYRIRFEYPKSQGK